ncbi:chemotaxis protein, partial [Helicobacter marmotae]
MLSWFSHLKFGIKLNIVLSLIVLVCIGAMAMIITKQSRNAFEKEAKMLLINAAQRQANKISPIFNESFAILENTQGIINNFLNAGVALDPATIDSGMKTLLDGSNWANYAYVFMLESFMPNGNKANYVSKNGMSGYLTIYHDGDVSNAGGVSAIKTESTILDFPAVIHAIKEQKSIFGIPVKITLNNETFYSVNAVVPLFQGSKLIGILGLSINLDLIINNIVRNKENSIFENDYIGILAPNATVAVHENMDLFGKGFVEVNADPRAQNIANAQKNRTDGIFEITNLKNLDALTAISTFEIWRGLDSYWSVIISAPQSSIFAPSTEITLTIFISALITFLLILFITYIFVNRTLVDRMNKISHTLFEFFNYLNHKRQTPPEPLRIIAQDELGQMGLAINENIQQTKIGLEQDAKAVEQSV